MKCVIKLVAAWMLAVGMLAAPHMAWAQPAPEAVDAALDKLVSMDPAQVAALLKQNKEQAAKWEAEAAALKQKAEQLETDSANIAAQLDALKARVEALGVSLGVSKKKPDMKMAPEGEMKMAAKPAGEMAATEAAAPAVTFQDQIAGIFRERCMQCHNQDRAKGGLSIETFSDLMEGGSSGDVIEAGSPNGSRLFKLVSGAEEPKMPPEGEPLSAEQLTLIRTWIELGAPENKSSKVMLAENGPAEENPVFIAAAIVDGPPPMPEVELPIHVQNPPRIPARAIATNPRSSLAAIAGYRQIFLYNLDDCSLIGSLPFPEGEVYSLSFTVSGEVLVAAGGEVGAYGCAVVWQVRNGERVGKYGETYDTVLAVDVSPDHRMIAVGGPNKKVTVYSMADGKQLYQLKDHSDWIYAVRFTPDGEVLSTADRSGGLMMWQAANGRFVETLRGHSGAIHDLNYSDDSVILASAGADGTVQMWDTWEFKRIRSFATHGDGTHSVHFSSANEVITTGVDGLTKRWDVNGKNIGTYEKLADWGYQARFGASGTKVIAGAWNGDVVVWNVAGERQAQVSTALDTPPQQVASAQ